MLKAIFLSLAVFFALYGLISFLLKLITPYTDSSKETDTIDAYTVLSVKNQADCIERIIRATVWQMLSQNSSRYVNELIIIDLGSTDETMSIMQALSREYDFIHPMTKQEYIDSIDKL